MFEPDDVHANNYVVSIYISAWVNSGFVKAEYCPAFQYSKSEVEQNHTVGCPNTVLHHLTM